MSDILIDVNSDLGQSFRDYTLGEMQDAAFQLLVMCVENSDENRAKSLEEYHHGISLGAFSDIEHIAKSRGEALFLMIAAGVDMLCTAISTIDKIDFMSEVDGFGS